MLYGLQLFIREVISLIRFYCINKYKREIVFYAEDKNSYSYFEGVIDYLTNKSDKDIYYITSEANDPLFKSCNKRLHVFYIKKLLVFFIGLCDSKVIVMTMPDLNLFHIKRSRFNTNHLYMFHNIGSSFPVIRYAALFHYDSIFCAGPHHIEEIRQQEVIYGLRRKELIEFGYFRLEKIYEQYQKYLKKEKRDTSQKPRVLIGPTWGENSIFNVCGNELIQKLVENGYEVIARPHPMTNIHEPHIMKDINSKFQFYHNYYYEEDVSYLESLFSSDVLITDWSGFMYEFSFGTERPVLFIDLPQKIVNPRYTEVGLKPVEKYLRKQMGEIVHPNNIDTINAKIDKLIANQERYKVKIQKLRSKYVYNFGNSSQAGADYLLGLCGETN